MPRQSGTTWDRHASRLQYSAVCNDHYCPRPDTCRHAVIDFRTTPGPEACRRSVSTQTAIVDSVENGSEENEGENLTARQAPYPCGIPTPPLSSQGTVTASQPSCSEYCLHSNDCENHRHTTDYPLTPLLSPTSPMDEESDGLPARLKINPPKPSDPLASIQLECLKTLVAFMEEGRKHNESTFRILQTFDKRVGLLNKQQRLIIMLLQNIRKKNFQQDELLRELEQHTGLRSEQPRRTQNSGPSTSHRFEDMADDDDAATLVEGSGRTLFRGDSMVQQRLAGHVEAATRREQTMRHMLRTGPQGRQGR